MSDDRGGEGEQAEADANCLRQRWQMVAKILGDIDLRAEMDSMADGEVLRYERGCRLVRER